MGMTHPDGMLSSRVLDFKLAKFQIPLLVQMDPLIVFWINAKWCRKPRDFPSSDGFK